MGEVFPETPLGSPPSRWRVRSVIVEAVQWTGANEAEVTQFCRPHPNLRGSHFDVLDEQDRAHCDDPEATAQLFDTGHSRWVLVYTGQWIVRGVTGLLFAVRDEKFREGYEPAGTVAPELAAAMADLEQARDAFRQLAGHFTQGRQSGWSARISGTVLRRLCVMAMCEPPAGTGLEALAEASELVAERDRLTGQLATTQAIARMLQGLALEVIGDLEHVVVHGDSRYVDRDMIADYRKRAGLDRDTPDGQATLDAAAPLREEIASLRERLRQAEGERDRYRAALDQVRRTAEYFSHKGELDIAREALEGGGDG